MNYYELLGISQNASAEEIKKAYRTLSLKLHPDRNKEPDALDQYKLINEAYETLSDVNEKNKYDFTINSDSTGIQHPFNNSPHFNPFHMFQNFSTNQPTNVRIFTHAPMNGHIDIDQLFAALQGGMSKNMQKPIPIIHHLSITLEQVLTGDNIQIQIEKWILDNGHKIYEFENINVDIPKGINENEVIIIREKGNQINEHTCGDVKIVISIQNNTSFKRSGLDLIYIHTITLKEALCGFKFELQYLNGKTYNINNTSGKVIIPGHITTIPSLGLTRNELIGSLQIHFKIDFPNSLTENQITQLNTVL